MANDELRALLAEAKGVIEGLDAIISGEISKEWADFFGKDYEDMSACLSRITAALAEKGSGKTLKDERDALQDRLNRMEALLREPDDEMIAAAIKATGEQLDFNHIFTAMSAALLAKL